jgi:cell wall-associated NlpC family hydrolase
VLVTNRPLPGGRLSSLLPPSGSATRKAPALVIAFAALLFATTAVSASADSVSSKQAEARAVLGQIQQLDSSLERAIEAYDLANVKLAHIKHDLNVNTHDLVLAKRSLKRAQRQLSVRVVELYTSQEQDSTLAVLLGSTSLDQMLSRMDAVDRLSQQDSLVLEQVTQLRREVRQRQHELKHAHALQTQVVAQRAAARSSIQSQLAQRHSLLSSIHGEIAKLQAEQQARQAELARQARAAQQAASTATIVQTVGVGGTGTGLAPPPPPTHGGVVGYAESQLGKPYVWGGASPSTGFDCSGLVMWAFAQVGVSLPHNAAAQFGYGSPVSRANLQPGDLVFFDGLGHVGIYVGGNTFIHAPHTGTVVQYQSLTGWYASTFVGARRI